VTLRRLDLCAEIYHLRAPQKIPLVMPSWRGQPSCGNHTLHGGT
jgi:hypothetical protein